MNGFMYLTAPCGTCGNLFNSNPSLVPVVVMNGNRIPICEECVKAANPKRIELGLPPIPVLPGAYEPEECY